MSELEHIKPILNRVVKKIKKKAPKDRTSGGVMNHKHQKNYYWCCDCRDWRFCDTAGDPKKNEIYILNTGRVDGVCKKHRLLRNAKYRPPKKEKRPKKIILKKDNRQTYAEIGRSKLSDIDRGKIEGFKKYFSQRPGMFKDTFHVDYSPEAAEREFRRLYESSY